MTRVAALAAIVLSYVSVMGAIPEFFTLPLVLVTLYLVWRELPGFWRVLAGGIVGGAVAGLLILGPGFRAAMRVVAIMDSTMATEFSWGGTMFIVVGIGVIMGGITTTAFQLARRVFSVESAVVAGSVMAGAEMVILTFFSGELSNELFELGLGAWVNIPLFGLVILGWGIAAMALADRFEKAMFPRPVIQREKVRA